MSATILYSDKVMKSVWGGGDHAPTEKVILAIAICKQHFSPYFKFCMCSIFTKAGKHVVKDEWEREYSSKAAVFDLCFSALFYLDGHTICQGLGPYEPWCSYTTVAYTTICC